MGEGGVRNDAKLRLQFIFIIIIIMLFLSSGLQKPWSRGTRGTEEGFIIVGGSEN